MIKICCVTGTRADYPRIRSVLKLLDNDPYFDLQIIVTGSHLLEEYGSTYKEIVDDGFIQNYERIYEKHKNPIKFSVIFEQVWHF